VVWCNDHAVAENIQVAKAQNLMTRTPPIHHWHSQIEQADKHDRKNDAFFHSFHLPSRTNLAPPRAWRDNSSCHSCRPLSLAERGSFPSRNKCGTVSAKSVAESALLPIEEFLRKWLFPGVTGQFSPCRGVIKHTWFWYFAPLFFALFLLSLNAKGLK